MHHERYVFMFFPSVYNHVNLKNHVHISLNA
jgi:hypothetical protein